MFGNLIHWIHNNLISKKEKTYYCWLLTQSALFTMPLAKKKKETFTYINLFSNIRTYVQLFHQKKSCLRVYTKMVFILPR